jgi:hypothetical protein
MCNRMQQNFIDLRTGPGPTIWQSVVQFYDFPTAVSGPNAQTEKALRALLAPWLDIEYLTIFARDWPAWIPFPTEH